MHWPWFIVCFAVLLIGITKSGLGAGLGLIVVPIAALALDHTERGAAAALGLLLPLLIAGDLIAVTQYRKLFRLELVRPLMLPASLGIAVGTGLLFIIHNQDDEKLIGTLIRLEIGFESVLLVGLHWWRSWRGIQQKLMPEPARSWLTGLFTGVSTTLAHAAGPIVAMYLLPLKPDRRTFVGTTALFFFFANSTKVPGYILAGQFEHAEIGFTIRFLPLVFIGAAIGFAINKRLTDLSFLRFVYFATFGIGVYLIVDALRRLIA